MFCKCDPSKHKGGECVCDRSPPQPGGDPHRAINPLVSPKYAERKSAVRTSVPKERTGPEPFNPARFNLQPKERQPPAGVITKRGCVSLEPHRKPPCAKLMTQQPIRPTCPAMDPEPPPEPPPCMREESSSSHTKKPIKKRVTMSDQKICRPGNVTKVPCGTPPPDKTMEPQSKIPSKIYALEKTMSKTQWQDEEGYHSASVTMSQLYRPEDHERREKSGGKPCGSEKRRNYLKAKLKELLVDAKPIPEGSFPDGVEAKPEPEVVAAALLMSEQEGHDLGKVKPDSVFNKLFSNSSSDRAVALASAAPAPMNDVVVPLTVQGQKPPSLDMPNSERMVQKTRGAAAPSPNAFEQSEKFHDYTAHKDDLLGRAPTTADVSGYLGVSMIGEPNKSQSHAESIMEYVIRPQPPSYRNRVQLNGSVRPPWFPGYTIVTPQTPGYIRITPNAGEALGDAWRLCRPQHFDELSKSLVNTG